MIIETMRTEYGFVQSYRTEKGVPYFHDLVMVDDDGQNRRGYFTGSCRNLERALTLSTIIKRNNKISP